MTHEKDENSSKIKSILLPCPFCGQSAFEDDWFDEWFDGSEEKISHYFEVGCKSCDFSLCEESSKQSIRMKWNIRFS